MPKITRRDSLLLFAPLFNGPGDRPSNSAPEGKRHWAQTSSRDVIRERYFPNLVLINHENRKVHFYDDLIKDKVLLINFMYTSCDRICPRVTQNLVKVQKLLGDRVGRDIFMYSFTLDPAHDTPQVLKEYATEHHVGPGWQFLTGGVDTMESLRKKLGFVDPDPKVDKDKESHIGNVRYGNEALQLWGACPGMSNAAFIVESLSWVDRPKNKKDV